MEFPRYLFVKNTLDPVLKNGNGKKEHFKNKSRGSLSLQNGW